MILPLKISDFDFQLPQELIARFPAERRDASRLMTVDRGSGEIRHCRFCDFPGMLHDDDFLVLNNSRVRPARLFGRINGKAAEMLVVKDLGSKKLEVLCRPAAHFRMGAVFAGDEGLRAEVLDAGARGHRVLRFDREYEQVLATGFAPLPPYIKRQAREARLYRDFDLQRYQTVYARNPGSIAAPTAGLHFTSELLAALRATHPLLEITLEVGEATFQKIEVEDIARHRMGSEDPYRLYHGPAHHRVERGGAKTPGRRHDIGAFSGKLRPASGTAGRGCQAPISLSARVFSSVWSTSC